MNMSQDIFSAALREHGLGSESKNERDERILQYFHETGFKNISDPSTPWCQAFVNWILKETKKEGTNSLMARSALKLGKAVTTPEPGDIVVFWREKPESPWGHSGFLIGTIDGLTYVLGGNQDNMVCIKPYPSERVLEYRRIDG